MDVKKSLIAVGISSVLMAGTWATASAKTAEDDDSVYRWGRWAVLAPAAGNEEVIAFAPAGTNDLGRCESAANCPSPSGSQNVPEEPEQPPEQPVATSPCEAGAPCGFARVDHPFDASQKTKPKSSDVVPFGLTLDEEGESLAFVVDPGAADEIDSGDVKASYNNDSSGKPLGVNTVRGNSSDLRGEIQAYNEQNEAALVQGRWRNTGSGVSEDTIINGGEYVWGVTATADQMQSLISSLGGDMTAIYQGITMGTTNGNEGTVTLDINFSSSTWSGNFNGDLKFSASGDVINSGFVSNADGFSNNIASGEVKGGFVNAGNNAIGGYEVVDTNGIQAADVFNTTLQGSSIQPTAR